jgi:hypothetical protein
VTGGVSVLRVASVDAVRFDPRVGGVSSCIPASKRGVSRHMMGSVIVRTEVICLQVERLSVAVRLVRSPRPADLSY